MKERVKIKTKESERGVSNRDTSFKKFVLKNNILRNKVINAIYPVEQRETSQNEVNYAENFVLDSVKNTTNYSNSLMKSHIPKKKSNDLIPIKGTEYHQESSIPNNGTELFSYKKIQLRHNFKIQKIYEKKYYIKCKHITINNKKAKNKQKELLGTTDSFSTFYKKEFVKKQRENNVNNHIIKVHETIRNEVRQKPKTYIKNRDTHKEPIKQRYIQTNVKLKQQKKHTQEITKSKTSKLARKEIAKEVATYTSKGLMTAICSICGVLVLIIVIIIALISSIFKTPVGFLFSDDSVDSINGDISIGNAIEVLEHELDEKVEEIKSEVDYDKLLIYGMTPN